MTKKVLFVCTSWDKLGTGPDAAATGSWMEEVAAPFYTFTGKGYEVTIASIKGGEIPFDDASLNAPFVTKDVEKFLLDDQAMAKVTDSKPLPSVNAAEFDCVFMPGGHGVCWDLPESAELVKQLEAAWTAGKVVAAVCHGPVGLVNVKDPATKEPLVKGKQVTGFTDSEECAVAKDHLVPFMLEAKLKELGGDFKCVDNWGEFAVRDGRLITGQNPASSKKVAELVIEALS